MGDVKTYFGLIVALQFFFGGDPSRGQAEVSSYFRLSCIQATRAYGTNTRVSRFGPSERPGWSMRGVGGLYGVRPFWCLLFCPRCVAMPQNDLLVSR